MEKIDSKDAKNFTVQFGLHQELTKYVMAVSCFKNTDTSIRIILHDDIEDTVRKALQDIGKSVLDVGIMYSDAEGRVRTKTLFKSCTIDYIEFDTIDYSISSTESPLQLLVSFNVKEIDYSC